VERLVLVSSILVTPAHRAHPVRALLNTVVRWGLMDYKFQGTLGQSLPAAAVLCCAEGLGMRLLASNGERVAHMPCQPPGRGILGCR
jgi:hypothetical protein